MGDGGDVGCEEARSRHWGSAMALAAGLAFFSWAGAGQALGASVPIEPIPCEGDACQPLPPEPEEPPVNTLVPGPGNPPVRYYKIGGKQGHRNQGHHKRKHRHSPASRA